MNDEVSDGIYEQLLELFLSLKQGFIAHHPSFDADGLTRLRLGALGILSRMGPLPASELARYLRISKPQTTALVDGLVATGNAVRKESAKDRRIVEVEITGEGLAALDRAMTDISANLKKCLSRLSETELVTLRDSLTALIPLLRKTQE